MNPEPNTHIYIHTYVTTKTHVVPQIAVAKRRHEQNDYGEMTRDGQAEAGLDKNAPKRARPVDTVVR